MEEVAIILRKQQKLNKSKPTLTCEFKSLIARRSL